VNSALAAARDVIRPGVMLEMTNHYITDPGHYCYGTARRLVLAADEDAFTVELGGHPDGDRIPWPPAGQVQADEDGTVRLYGGGKGQAPGDLFLTVRPVRET
jgi:hypothetical protein